jgi:YD repeat-containing protein
MYGTGYFNLVSGAQSVTGTSNSGGNDQAYQYDGSGPSIFTINGNTSSTMSGTDNNQSFLNKAVGFDFTYGMATHANDTAIFNAGAGPEVFVGDTADSYLYADGAAVGALAMFDGVYGFSKVYANGAAGGHDIAYVQDAKVNIVKSFQLLA